MLYCEAIHFSCYRSRKEQVLTYHLLVRHLCGACCGVVGWMVVTSREWKSRRFRDQGCKLSQVFFLSVLCFRDHLTSDWCGLFSFTATLALFFCRLSCTINLLFSFLSSSLYAPSMLLGERGCLVRTAL